MSNAAGSTPSNAATLTVTAAALAPTVTTQPQNQTVSAGATATFTVVASGTAPLSYQWSKNGTAIAGATNASYTTPATVSGETARPSRSSLQCRGQPDEQCGHTHGNRRCRGADDHGAAAEPDRDGRLDRNIQRGGHGYGTLELPVVEEWDGY